jgi:hypothetical protein
VIPLFDKPYKKMERVSKFGFTARCDCGHEHKFKGADFDLNKSNGATAVFNIIYTCPKCGTQYDGIFENITDRNVWYRRLNPIGMIVTAVFVFGLLFGGYKVLSYFTSPPSYHDINHATNKELQDFYKWDEKQQQQKRDNQPALNNGN